MSDTQIMILGDSTSMSIGMEPCMYPILMAATPCWPANTTLTNCSQPGITSADASAFFMKHRKDGQLKAVIIHLGTCDSTSSEINKGKYTLLRQLKYYLLVKAGKERKKTRLKNQLLHFQWNNKLNPDIEHPEKPSSFDFNLSRIIRACEKQSISVILIRPKSNPAFLPGIGKGNFIFYSYSGLKTNLSRYLKIPDTRFLEAWSHHENGEFISAMKIYREILSDEGPLSDSLEYSLLITNNYAVAAFEAGLLEESETLLTLLLKDPNSRREIILYNLAHLKKAKGDIDQFNHFLTSSYEADDSLYRIRAPYLQVIDKLALQHKNNVKVIDLHQIIDNSLYVDHCHPLPEGQALVAKHVSEALKSAGIQGNQPAQISNKLYNLEQGLGNNAEFYTYFGAYAPFTRSQIQETVSQFKDYISIINKPDAAKTYLQTLPEQYSRAFDYYLKHPAFPAIKDTLDPGPKYPSDVGRFPEFYLLRYTIPYLVSYEKTPELNTIFSHSTGILRHSYELSSALPPSVRSLVSDNTPAIDTRLENDRLPRILRVVKDKLLDHLSLGAQVYERAKTTIFWYFRETLRYGSHSRVSMRYDRVALEYMAEGLAIALVLDKTLGSFCRGQIISLVRVLETTVDTHDHYCLQFSLNKDCTVLLQDYNQNLFKIARQLEGINIDGKTNAHPRGIGVLS